MEDEKTPKYQYHVCTWGGFYNKEYKEIHGYEPGDYSFDSDKEREEFISRLKKIEKELRAYALMASKTEGYACNVRTVGHRITRYKGKEYYSQRDFGVNYPMGAAEHMMKWNWYVGFNDDPLGEDHDYEKDPVEVVSEWVTGAFPLEIEQ